MNDWMAELHSCNERLLPFVIVDGYRKLERSGASGSPSSFLRDAARVIAQRSLDVRVVLAAHLAAGFELLEGNSAAVERFLREELAALSNPLSPDDVDWLSEELRKYGLTLAFDDARREPAAAGTATAPPHRDVVTEVHLVEAVPPLDAGAGASAADVVIVCALDEEFDAFEPYFEGTVVQAEGRRRYRELITVDAGRLVLVGVSSQGNVRSALATRWAIDKWRPMFVVLAGIAGGIYDSMSQYNLGDVVVPPRIVGYEIAKVTPGEIRRRIHIARSGQAMLDAADRASKSGSWGRGVLTARPDGSAELPVVRVGDVLSGEKVIADKVFLDDLRSVWPEGIAVEMEAIGLATAAYETAGSPEVLVAKAVCDWADPLKSDGWHEYACAVSAAFTMAVCFEMRDNIAKRRNVRPKRIALRLNDGTLRNAFALRIGNDWRLLANVLKVSDYERGQWGHGVEGDELWAWALRKSKLQQLPDRLEDIGRDDIAALFYSREPIVLTELQ